MRKSVLASPVDAGGAATYRGYTEAPGNDMQAMGSVR